MNLYLYLEILNREFLSKMLIAMESASKGVSVYFGRVKPYLLRGFFEPGVILEKSNTPAPKKIEELLKYKKNNFIVTSLDEEVGLFKMSFGNKDDVNQYVRLRYSDKSLSLIDKIFTWGLFDLKNLENNFKRFRNKFVLSGNPRLDYWRKNFEFFFKQKNIKYNDYILFSLNFSYLTSEKEFYRRLKILKKNKYFERGWSEKFVKKKRSDSFQMHKKFIELITELSKNTNRKIVVRPHPTDNLRNYRSLKKYKNIIVSKDGSISEWIYNSKLVIHSGCTGGFESSIRGFPTIAFTPFKSSHGHESANKYSLKANNLKECLKLISRIETKKVKIKKNKFKIIKNYAVNLLSKKPAYKIISENIFELLHKRNYSFSNNDLLLKVKFKSRDLRSKILRKKYGDENKFTYFSKAKVLKVFKTLQALNPKYQDIKINFLKKDIILIKK